jgi:tRNA(Ile)-lysidine synthase
MKGMKKVSDFLIDLKVDRFEKDKVWVLTSEEKIVNVLSFRLDERFKIEKDSNCVYLVHLKTKEND